MIRCPQDRIGDNDITCLSLDVARPFSSMLRYILDQCQDILVSTLMAILLKFVKNDC